MTVDYATNDSTARAGKDYTATRGTLTFPDGVKSQTINVPIVSNQVADGTRRFTVTLFNPLGGATLGESAVAEVEIIDGDFIASSLIISEFRLRGSGGATDEFIEIYNNTDVPFDASTLDGQGYTLSAVIPERFQTDFFPREPIFKIPNGTIIPPRGHYLAAGAGYTPDSLVAPDQTYTTDIPDNASLVLGGSPARVRGASFVFRAPSYDRIGFTRNGNPQLEPCQGQSLAPIEGIDIEQSFVRRTTNGRPQDTNDDSADFVLISTTGGMFGSVQSTLGAPGAENLQSPVANVPPVVRVEPLDRRVSIDNSPNTVRDATPVMNGSRGTILMRRTLINESNEPVSRLRFRIVSLPTLGGNADASGAPLADLRALSASGARVTLSDGTIVNVIGTTLEAPAQPLGGGLNSTLAVSTITTDAPLKAGATVSVELRFGVERAGRYRVGLVLERDSNIGGRRSMRGRSRSTSRAK